MMAMTSRDQRAIAMGAAILLPALLFIWGLRPFLTADAERRVQVEAVRAVLARERALLAATDRGPTVLATADSVLYAAATRLFDAPDDDIAGERLTSYVAAVARSSNVLMLEAAGRRVATSRGGVRTIQVEIRAESDFQGIVEFLQALEDGPRLVRLAGFTVTPGIGVEEEAAGIVRIRATIDGFGVTTLQRPEAPSAAVDGASAAEAVGKGRAAEGTR